MNALFITPFFHPKTGGMERYAYAVATGLSDMGWNISVITGNHFSPEYSEERIGRIRVFRLPISWKISNTPVSLAWYRYIRQISIKVKPDIINGHMPVPFIADLAARYAASAHIPFILTYQNDLEKNTISGRLIVTAYYSLLGYGTLNISNRIIVTTRYFLKSGNRLNVYKNKICIIPPGLPELPPVRRYGIPNHAKREKRILFVGQLDKTHAHKGIHNLLASFQTVASRIPTAILTIVGKGNAVDGYKNLCLRMGIQRSVEFTGYVTDAKLAAYYSNSRAIILPSTNNSEGFGLVIIEAAQYHTPGIGTDVGGIPYVIEDGKTGIIAPTGKPDMIADVLVRLLNNPVLCQQLGDNAASKAKHEFSYKKMIVKTDRLFRSVI